jgi:hypothetical protein
VDGGSDERSWTQRSNMVSRGVLRTGDEFSLYITRRYCWEDARLVRYAARPFGFSALEAGDGVGTLRTKPVVFSGETLFVNFATAAPGSLRAGLIEKHTLAHQEQFGIGNPPAHGGEGLQQVFMILLVGETPHMAHHEGAFQPQFPSNTRPCSGIVGEAFQLDTIPDHHDPAGIQPGIHPRCGHIGTGSEVRSNARQRVLAQLVQHGLQPARSAVQSGGMGVQYDLFDARASGSLCKYQQ